MPNDLPSRAAEHDIVAHGQSLELRRRTGASHDLLQTGTKHPARNDPPFRVHHEAGFGGTTHRDLRLHGRVPSSQAHADKMLANGCGLSVDLRRYRG
ncbi:MAG: hypothetical protein WDO56_19070 [Gammaproteobacteria bacterium]